ncbi:MAG: TetR/AcrR family transcriptional regulator [Pseudomonadota bacterium]
MPRPKTHTKDSLIQAAMHQFWRYGYGATSMDDLVKATGVSRHGIYAYVGGKQDLFLQGFDAYRDTVVAPALRALQAGEHGLAGIRAYFDTQIDLAERVGLPGPGCLVANAMTETAPHDDRVQAQVEAHNQRLTRAFDDALKAAAPRLDRQTAAALSAFLTLTAQGLWSMSRTTNHAQTLRDYVETLLDLVKLRIDP